MPVDDDLRAIAYDRPGYGEAVQDALQGREETFARYTPPGWEGRVWHTASTASTHARCTN
ncbi:hypothetical protein [Actinomadura sp. 9N215]|uniref:hypothetical protein n=1 Tax=Actinomadura sp. 9N215 TaxID=3375150 RepID=UPI003792B233